MTFREIVLPEDLHASSRQAQESELVGYRRLTAPQALCRLLLTEAVSADKPGNGSGFLYVVKILTLKIFHQRQYGALLVAQPDDQARHTAESCHPRGPEPPLPRHQHITPAGQLLNAQRLQDAMLANGFRQCPHELFLKMPARLTGIGGNLLNRDLVNAPRCKLNCSFLFHNPPLFGASSLFLRRNVAIVLPRE